MNTYSPNLKKKNDAIFHDDFQESYVRFEEACITVSFFFLMVLIKKKKDSKLQQTNAKKEIYCYFSCIKNYNKYASMQVSK